MSRVVSVTLFLLLLGSPAPVLAADTIADDLATAQQAYAKGELLKAGGALQSALDALHGRLADAFVPLMPPAPAGWQAYDAQADAMGITGGGMTVMRGYEKGEASLNASIILDSEAVKGVADILGNPAALAAQPGMSKVATPGGGQALLRWDPKDKTGEIMLVVGDQLLLQVVGNALDKPDILAEMMRNWNITAIRKQAGM
jgi:hypothetical protein